MSLVINSTSVQKDWTFTENGWKLNGNSNHNGTTGAINNFNCQVFKLEGDVELYDGNANGFRNGENLKVNINDVPTSLLAEVSQVIEDLVDALEGVDE